MSTHTSLFALRCLALAALTWLSICAAGLVRTLEAVARDAPKQVDAAVAREASRLRLELRLESAAWRGIAERQADAAREDAARESAAWRATTERELAVSRTVLDGRLSQAVDQLGEFRKDLVHVVSPPARSLTRTLDQMGEFQRQVGQRLDPWTDCKGNGACWQAQATALLGASRATAGETSRTMRAVREATPAIVTNIERTTANVERMTKPDSLGTRIFKLTAPIVGGVLFGSIK